MRLTSKGQVTIPLRFREQFGLFPNTEVAFEATNNGVLIKSSADGRRRRLQASLRKVCGSATAKFSTDEILRLTRGED